MPIVERDPLAPVSDTETPSLHSLLPAWLNAHRSEIDQAITMILAEYRPEVRVLAEDAASRGRKLRGTLALQLAEWCDWKITDEQRVNLLRDIARIEILHSMSCVLDDVIDQDDVRRGTPSFHVRQNSKAVAMLLPLLFASDFATEEGLKEMLHQVIIGELFDSHLLAKHGLDHFANPVDEYLQKSAPPFAHSHMLTAKHAGRPQEEIESSNLYGAAIGKYYQAANDHHDCFTIPVDARGDIKEMVPLNFSIPFYLYCKKNPEFTARLGTTVTRQEFAEIIEAMKEAGIEQESHQYVQAFRSEVESNFPGETVPDELQGFLNMVDTPQFWSYQYRAGSPPTE